MLAAAGSTRLVGIGGRTSSHELLDKLSKVLIALYLSSHPPIVVSASLITVMAMYAYLHCGSLVHLFSGTLYEYTLWP